MTTRQRIDNKLTAPAAAATSQAEAATTDPHVCAASSDILQANFHLADWAVENTRDMPVVEVPAKHICHSGVAAYSGHSSQHACTSQASCGTRKDSKDSTMYTHDVFAAWCLRPSRPSSARPHSCCQHVHADKTLQSCCTHAPISMLAPTCPTSANEATPTVANTVLVPSPAQGGTHQHMKPKMRCL